METTTDIYEMNSTLKTSPLNNMDFINYQQILFKPNQESSSDLDNSFIDSPKREKVCFDSISESKRKLKFKRVKKDLQY